MTLDKKYLLRKACENAFPAYNLDFPLSLYDWSFVVVNSKQELLEHLKEDYQIRNGFIFENLAMVQQVNGGDEWLTLRLSEQEEKYEVIESVSFCTMQEKYTQDYMKIYLNKLSDPGYSMNKHQMFTPSHCDTSLDIDYTNKLLVLRKQSLGEKYQSSEYQLFYATGGFGCDPTASGRAIYGYHLSDKENARWDCNDFIGVLKEEHTPLWAKATLKEWNPINTQEENQMMLSKLPSTIAKLEKTPIDPNKKSTLLGTDKVMPIQEDMPHIVVRIPDTHSDNSLVPLPLNPEQLRNLYKKYTWDMDYDFTVTPQQPPHVKESPTAIENLILLQKDISFQKLCLLTARIASMDIDELDQMNTIARACLKNQIIEGTTTTLDHLLNHSYSLQDWVIVSGIHSDRELGEVLVELGFVPELTELSDYLPEDILERLLNPDNSIIDFSAIGKKQRQEFGGMISDFGGKSFYYESPNGLYPEEMTVDVSAEWDDQWKDITEIGYSFDLQ